MQNSSHVVCNFATGDDEYLVLRVCNPQSQCRAFRILISDDFVSLLVDKQVIAAREPVTLKVELSRKRFLTEPRLLLGKALQIN